MPRPSQNASPPAKAPIVHAVNLPDSTVDEALLFPRSHHLIVTSKTNVYSWNASRVTEIFRSGSKGIVAAKNARDGSRILAVADSQVVVLHDAKRGMDKSYRLKGADGQVRILKYANDSKTLFFTTTLQNAVQSYSLRQSKLLDPSHTHPSPPTCLALSATSHLLLSASIDPPVIYLQNLTLRTAPVLMRPNISSAAVAVAAFHPSRSNIFLLGFVDGTIAAYDATRFFGQGRKGDRNSGAEMGHGDEVGYIRHLHASGTTSTPEDPPKLLHGAALGEFDDGTRTVSVGSAAISITAAAFVPGFHCRSISVGADGKCCLVDFECGGTKEREILDSWHVRGPATSLSILPLQETLATAEPSRPGSGANAYPGSEGMKESTKGYVIAIGRVDGKVLLFTLAGLLVSERSLDVSGGPIIDVEWMDGPCIANATKDKENRSINSSATSRTSRPKLPSRTSSGNGMSNYASGKVPKSKRKSLSSMYTAGRPIEEEVIAMVDDGADLAIPSPAPEIVSKRKSEAETLKISPKQSAWQEVTEASISNYMNLFSPVKQQTRRRSPKAAALPSARRQISDSAREEKLLATAGGGWISAICAPQLCPEAEPQVKVQAPPSIPHRPTSQKKRWDSARKDRISSEEGETGVSTDVAPTNDGQILANLRLMSAKRPEHNGRGLALFAPYMQNKVIKDTSNPTKPNISPSSSISPENTKSDPLVGDIWLTDNESTIAPLRKSSRKPTTTTKPNTTSKQQRRKTVSFDATPEDVGDIGEPKQTIRRTPYKAFEVHNDHNIPRGNTESPIRNHFIATRPSTPRALVALGETSRNIRPVVSGSPTKPLLSEKQNLSGSHQAESSILLQEQLARMQTLLLEEMRLLRVEMANGFSEQKEGFDRVLADEMRNRKILQEENGRLRREVERREQCRDGGT
ncbi:MAG: hypothetical protein M1827_007192 [Pycnora praestabilis]|nr:MAG: hypothetical protein M1827_007192 [Pycnora praestabilis]